MRIDWRRAMRVYVLLCCGLLYSLPSVAVTVTGVNAQNQSQASATLVFDLSGQCKYHVFALTHPNRVVIDLDNTNSRIKTEHVVQGHGVLLGVRQGYPAPNRLRLVLDARVPIVFTEHVEVLRPSHRVRLYVKLLAAPAVPAAPIAVGPQAIPVHPTKILPPVTLNAKRDVVIVLDPGHGGHDPGAMGPSHRAEKHVVLAIAKLLKKKIDSQVGMHALLTREGDYYVGLRERLSFARRHNADVFISIHADAFIHTESHGASVFALSQRGATSEAARWLAEKENNSELGRVNLKKLDDKSGLIRTVLLDLSQTATISASLQLGQHVLRDVGKITSLHNKQVEQARFVVLKSPDTPSILVETGFISNPREAKNLTDPAYQMRLAQAIFTGLKQYFSSYPPYGSRLEALLLAQDARVR